MKNLFVAAAILMLVAACNNTPGNNALAGKDTVAAVQPNAARLELEGTDGVELFFYPNPEDRKVYRQLSLTDSAQIALLCSNFMQDTVARAECPHDVKMYLLKGGEVFKTVYGATADSCRYFAYAINSNPHFTPMVEPAYRLLDSLRRTSQ